MRWKISVCCSVLLAANACVGVNAQQTPLNGGVSSAGSPFAGQDPLAGRGVVMPRPSSGKCIPPGKANWKLLAEKHGDCYYFAPFATRLNGFVVNMSDVGVVERLGGRCGLDEFDQAKAVCFNPGDELPGALPTVGFPGGISNSPPNNPGGWGGSGAPGATTPYGGTVANGGTASGGTAANGTTARGGTAASGGVTDPCHPYYDMSTPAGRARAVQLAAQTKQACDEYRCKHNPQLPFCFGVTGQPPPGANGANANPNAPLVDTIQYTAGFVNGLGDCIQGMVDMAAGAGWMARGLADLSNPTPFHFANGDEFVNAARLLGVQPGQSITLRLIAMESQAQVVGQKSNPYDAATAAGRRFCAFGVVPGVTKALKGAKSPPNPKTLGATPAEPIAGPTLRAAVSEDAMVGGLGGQWVQTPAGPLQLGNFVGKGTFGAVFEVAKNPAEVIKIATNDPFSPESFANQVKGSNLLKEARVPTVDITPTIPAMGGQPSMLFMDNAFQKPGAFQITSKGFKRTQATIDARAANGGLSGGLMERATPAEINGVDQAMQELNDKIAGSGLILGDNHLGNVVMVPKAGGGFTAIIVDADFVVTKNDLVKQLGGRTGQQLLADMAGGKPVPPIARVMLSVLDAGGGLDALGPNLTAQGVMNALSKARQRISNSYSTPASLTPTTPTPRVN